MSNESGSKASMLEKVISEDGFIAALDQSGGSTPKALALYGIENSEFTNDEQMYDLVHQMRTRIVTNASFTGERILGAILFENTLDREFEGKSSAQYLWQEKQIVPFLKVDKGLCDEVNDVQLMKSIPDLDSLLDKAVSQGVFGTKMRSVIKLANQQGINDIVAQQFDVAKQILAKGLIPIIEPEIDINSAEKPAAEVMLKAALLKALDKLSSEQRVMLKLTLPDTDNFYADCINHKNIIKVVALSGGYTRELANTKVAANHGMIASFSRALTQGLSAKQSDIEFTNTLDSAIDSIFNASKT
ncbi:MAG: fructose bisphosphate aldolase [Colwellia sp.]|nr:fructose bisphosphate aldolase [Colwellia sp.]MCW8866729.1 fructose bisphosphate aldolase [Colwellia sp.]MCW9082435.1 fructose bisphosphate aldolase [Colwellia sp.]